MASTLCRDFAAGSCRFGARCRFSHDLEAARSSRNESDPPRRDSSTPQTPSKSDEMDELFKRWRFKVPKDDIRSMQKSQPLGTAMGRFFQDAFQLVEAGGATMQNTIQTLACSGGLIRIRELVSQDFESMNDDRLATIWKCQLLPFLMILSNDNVSSSLVVETQHVTLFNTIYGIDGKHAVELFKAMARCLTADDTAKAATLELCLAAVAGVLQRNDAAKINGDLKDIAAVFLALLDGKPMSRATERHARSIRMSLGLEISEAKAKPIPSAEASTRATFTMAQDMPGKDSELGPRHDNDFTDIRDIQILPTLGEINGIRSEYLPRDNPEDWHKGGVAGLIDRHFRLVREDTVGQLRDAATAELQRLRPLQSNARSHQRHGAHTYAYHNIELKYTVMAGVKGMLFVLSFDQPRHVQSMSSRQRLHWWEDSRRLTAGSLICLLAEDGRATFLVVDDEMMMPTPAVTRLHREYTRSQDAQKGYLIAQLTSSDAEALIDFHKYFKYAKHQAPIARSVIEFPGVLLAAFEPTLQALQYMSDNLDIPFGTSLVPGSEEVDTSPPAYSMDPDFRWSLESIAPGMAGTDMNTALEASSLDSAQQRAVHHALTHRLALIQGPPGTGKSYTGVKLIQTLVENKMSGKLGPIICVCYTNHALDQLLEHLLDAKVKNIIRIGSRSKSVRLESVNLRTVARKFDPTRVEKIEYGKAHKDILKASKVISADLDSLTGLLSCSEEAIAEYLKENLPHFHSQLFNGVDEDGFQTVFARSNAPLHNWLHGGSHRSGAQCRSLEVLQDEDTNIFNLTKTERRLLCQSWLDDAISEVYEDLEVQLDAYQDLKETLQTVRGELNLRVLSHANVVGLTTTGLAKNIKHLRKLTSKVLVVEEAGEVLEAHLLTAMLPSLEHAIMIGDHQQLRPKVQNYDLSVDNPYSQVSLDVSLFERLVQPRGPAASAGIPFQTLETQRRMHPSVSNLIRSTLYPDLQDAPSVFEYPEVVGMRQRLFWFDHDKWEDGKDQNLLSTSHTNEFEIEMVAALVRHLVRQGVYSADEIAVLTPYLAQLRKLRHKLSSFMDIVLNDLDVDDLARDGDSDDEQDDRAADRPPPVTKGTLLQALRIATVDNFQGEEAKVVIVSLVRSNPDRQCGFLRTSNRINVLLSRAQHGMYIIGNSDTTGRIQMWRDVLDLLKTDGNYGKCLELCCPRHPNTPLPVTDPEHFIQQAPEAGCGLLCADLLSCGHACPSKCHAQNLHNAVICIEDCERPRAGCDHPCNLPCGEICEEICTQMVTCDLQLECGHRITSLPCWQYQKKQDLVCNEVVDRIVSGCGHKVIVPCVTNMDDAKFQCNQSCATELDCGHYCTKSCNKCRPRTEGQISKVDHGDCTKVCGQKHSMCQHSCDMPCHSGTDCSPCKMPCMAKCTHGRCLKKCCEPCKPCTKPCALGCQHSSCELPCAAPCDFVPCYLRCEKKLYCGHQCPSLCGEVCPQTRFCQVCGDEKIKQKTADLVLNTIYSDVELDCWPILVLSCGHFFTVDSLDGAVGLSEYFHLDEEGKPFAIKDLAEVANSQQQQPHGCPECGASLQNVARYGRVLKHATQSATVEQLAVSSREAYHDLLKSLSRQQESLANSIAKAVHLAEAANSSSIRHIPCIDKAPASLIDTSKRLGIDRLPSTPAHTTERSTRYQLILELRQDVWKYLQECKRQRQGVAGGRRQNRNQLLARALLVRCDLVMLTDIVTVYDKMPVALCSATTLRVNLAEAREQCNALHKAAADLGCPIQQAEADILWAQLAALECNALHLQSSETEQLDTSGQSKLRELKLDAKSRLAQSQLTLQKSVGTCVRLEEEIKAVKQMLRSLGGMGKFRIDVGAMMAEFDNMSE